VATGGYLDELPVDDAKRFVEEFIDHLASRTDVLETIRTTGDLPEEAETSMKQTLQDFRQAFEPTEAGPGSAAAAGVGSARDALREDVGWDRLSSEGDDEEGPDAGPPGPTG
jgi:F-type H+-transporting ATPase subunit alpha